MEHIMIHLGILNINYDQLVEYWNIGVIGILTKSEIPQNPTKSASWFLTCFFPFHIWDIILPIDELHHFSS